MLQHHWGWPTDVCVACCLNCMATAWLMLLQPHRDPRSGQRVPLRDNCVTADAVSRGLTHWCLCCLLSKLHGDCVTDAAATTPGSTDWTAGTTAWQLRDCWCCLTGADYISLDCVHGISCKFIMTGVPRHQQLMQFTWRLWRYSNDVIGDIDITNHAPNYEKHLPKFTSMSSYDRLL